MDPDFDITLNPGDGGPPDAAKSHFLDSLGFGERSLLGETPSAASMKEIDEGVVLSSQPDDLGYPGPMGEPARGLAVSMSVTRHATRFPATDISLPQEEEPEPEPQGLPSVSDTLAIAPASKVEASDPEEILNLPCPDCGGALVLQRRHLGVEGACVWCHTPIVAAASGRDGQVRIFPILGGSAATSSAVATTPVVTEAVVAELLPEPEAFAEMVDTAEEPVLSPDFSFLPPAEESEKSEPADSFDEGFSAMQEVADIEPDFSSTVEPLDIDSLYGSGGFVPPGEEAPTVPEDEAPLGFGAFLQTPSAATTATTPSSEMTSPPTGFSGPVPWGPPVRPAATPPKETVSEITPPSQDEAPAALPSDFSADFADSTSSPLPTWEAAFGDTSTTTNRIADDYTAAFGGAFSTGSAPESDEPSPGFSLPATPATDRFAPPSDEAPIAFLAEPQAFSMDTPPDEPKPASLGLFGGDSAPGTLPWGAVSATPKDEAPFPLATESAPAAMPAPLFPASATPAPNLFSEIPATPVESPFSPAAETPQGSEIETPGAPLDLISPKVTSQPLGAKPKTKVRKGFLVLMVVILGFACGGALASYVLPMDRYVAAARAYMEAKFAPQPAVPVMPQMPVVPGAALPPADFQP